LKTVCLNPVFINMIGSSTETLNFTLRPMRYPDVSAVVQIHTEGFPNSRSTKLGKPFLRKMYRWFLSNYPDLAIVAAADGQLLGFVTGGIGGSSSRIFRYAFLEIVWGFLRHPGLFLQAGMFEAWRAYLAALAPWRGRAAPAAQPAPAPVKATLDSIAVSNHARGKNVGQALVGAFEDAARRQGATYLRLGVEYDNTAARRLYETCGWELEREDAAHNSTNYIKVIRRV